MKTIWSIVVAMVLVVLLPSTTIAKDVAQDKETVQEGSPNEMEPQNRKERQLFSSGYPGGGSRWGWGIGAGAGIGGGFQIGGIGIGASIGAGAGIGIGGGKRWRSGGSGVGGGIGPRGGILERRADGGMTEIVPRSGGGGGIGPRGGILERRADGGMTEIVPRSGGGGGMGAGFRSRSGGLGVAARRGGGGELPLQAWACGVLCPDDDGDGDGEITIPYRSPRPTRGGFSLARLG